MTTAILVVTAVFRLAKLQDIPPGLARDETLNADIASFILQGRHALFFREGYGHEPLYHYLGAAVQPLFGDNYLAIRLPSVYLGLMLVAAAMAFARRLWRQNPGRLLVPALTGLFLAVSWWPIILSRVGLRPILEPLILVGAIVCWGRRPYLAGFLLGLATYSYTAARVVLIIPFLMLLYLFLFRNKLQVGRDSFKAALITGVVALLVYAPLGLTLRADPTLQERVNQLSGPLDALLAGDFSPIWQTTVATLGVFSFTGDPLSSYALPDVPLFGLLMSLLFYGGLLFCLSRIGRDANYGLLLIWLGTTLLPSAAAADAPSLIRLVGAMPVVYLLPAMAVGWLYGQAVRWYGETRLAGRYAPITLGTAVFLAIILAANIVPTFRNGFQQWTTLPDTRQKYQSIWLDISRHWRDQGQDTEQSLVVADSWYEPVKADSLRRDFGQSLPARWVQQGRAIVFPVEQPVFLYVPEFAAPLPLLRETAGLAAPSYRSEAFPSFALYDLTDAAVTLENAAEVQFMIPETAEPALTLVGWEVDWVAETADLQLLSYWQVMAPLPWDTMMFAHLWDEQGQAAAQHDTFDAVPATLQPGDRFLQLQTIQVENQSEPYRLVIGLYNLQSLTRWQQVDGDPADALILLTDWRVGGGT